jgi:hypothetical protein
MPRGCAIFQAPFNVSLTSRAVIAEFIAESCQPGGAAKGRWGLQGNIKGGCRTNRVKMEDEDSVHVWGSAGHVDGEAERSRSCTGTPQLVGVGMQEASKVHGCGALMHLLISMHIRRKWRCFACRSTELGWWEATASHNARSRSYSTSIIKPCFVMADVWVRHACTLLLRASLSNSNVLQDCDKAANINIQIFRVRRLVPINCNSRIHFIPIQSEFPFTIS